MNMKQLIAAVAATFTMGSAFAIGTQPHYPGSASVESGKSRAQVQQELRQARMEGHAVSNEANYPTEARVTGHKSRQAVAADLAEAQQKRMLTPDLYSGT